MTINSNFTDLTLGESIAVDGICLTVAYFTAHQFTVDLSPETLRLTTASSYMNGWKVNLERSLRLMDRFGGHFVTGHVDCQYQVKKISRQDEYLEIVFKNGLHSDQKYLTKKGSITVNGVSLTVNEITEDGFAAMLIPHTLEKTNLSFLRVDSHVNIEYDYLAKIIYNQVKEIL